MRTYPVFAGSTVAQLGYDNETVSLLIHGVSFPPSAGQAQLPGEAERLRRQVRSGAI